MGHPPRLRWPEIEKQLFNRAKYKKELTDDQPVYTIDDLKFISDKVARECWKNCCDTIQAVVDKDPSKTMGSYDFKWIRDKIILVIRPLLYKAVESFKQKKGIK